MDSAYTGLTRNARVVIVYNSDVSWSLTLATRYANKKHIPLANLFGYAFGTNVHWEPANPAAIYAMTSALETLWDFVGAQAILLAPGCPNAVQVTGVLDTTPAPDVWYPAGTGYPDLGKLCSGAKRFNDVYLTVNRVICCGLTYGTDYWWLSHRTDNDTFLVMFSEFSTFPAPTYWAGGAGFNIAGWQGGAYSAFYSECPGSVVSVDLPLQPAIDLIGLPQNLMLPYGRIGFWWNTYGIYPQPDPSPYNLSFAMQAKVMEQGMRYAEASTPDNRYRARSHFILRNVSGQEGLAYMASLMDGWGYQVDYAYSGTGSALQQSFCPTAGGVYTLAELEAGKIRDHPYHLMVGIFDGNDSDPPNNPYKPPLAPAWKPDGGGGVFAGPSFGYGYALAGLARGGASGLTNSSHITSGFYLGMQTMLTNLLRGMNWAEASFWSHECGQQSPPCGDPLARPFPA